MAKEPFYKTFITRMNQQITHGKDVGAIFELIQLLSITDIPDHPDAYRPVISILQKIIQEEMLVAGRHDGRYDAWYNKRVKFTKECIEELQRQEQAEKKPVDPLFGTPDEMTRPG